VVNSLLVEIGAKVLPVPIDQLNARQCAIATRVEISEDLLQLDSVVHVQEVLDQVAQCGLLSGVFGGERAQVGESPRDVLAPLVNSYTVGLFFHSRRKVEPGMLEGLGRGDAVLFLAEDASDQVLALWGSLIPTWSLHRVLADLDQLDGLIICISIEGRLARDENVEDNTNTPDIALLAISALNDLRCDVV